MEKHDIVEGKVFSVHAAQYPSEVETVLKGLSNPVAFSFHEGVVYVVECTYKDLASEKVLDPQKMTVAQLKVALCKLGVEKSKYRYLEKYVANYKSEKKPEYGRHCMASHPIEGGKRDQQTKFTLRH